MLCFAQVMPFTVQRVPAVSASTGGEAPTQDAKPQSFAFSHEHHLKATSLSFGVSSHGVKNQNFDSLLILHVSANSSVKDFHTQNGLFQTPIWTG